jgi:hypothetical protein
MDTSKAESLSGASLPGRVEILRKHIQQELHSPEDAFSIQPFILHYLKRWGIVQDDDGMLGQHPVSSYPWHDWYDSDRR